MFRGVSSGWRFWVGGIMASLLAICGAVYGSRIRLVLKDKPVPPNKVVSNNSIPISMDNMLVYGIRINEVSKVLNLTIQQSNFEFPQQIHFRHSDLSYKTERQSWISVNDENIYIYIFQDVASKLTPDEVVAYGVHELAHILLGHYDHTNPQPSKARDINEEKEADLLTVRAGINPDLIISAINKLVPGDYDGKQERITALQTLITTASSN